MGDWAGVGHDGPGTGNDLRRGGVAGWKGRNQLIPSAISWVQATLVAGPDLVGGARVACEYRCNGGLCRLPTFAIRYRFDMTLRCRNMPALSGCYLGAYIPPQRASDLVHV